MVGTTAQRSGTGEVGFSAAVKGRRRGRGNGALGEERKGGPGREEGGGRGAEPWGTGGRRSPGAGRNV